MARETLDEKIAKAAEKKRQAAARLQQLEGRASEQRRKAETRAKIVIGGTIIAHMVRDEAFREQIIALLREHVTREIDIQAVSGWLSPSSKQA